MDEAVNLIGGDMKYASVTQDDFIHVPLTWQVKGLQQTQSGYGNKLTTPYKVKHNGRLKRVYSVLYSNIGSLFIMVKGDREFIL